MREVPQADWPLVSTLVGQSYGEELCTLLSSRLVRPVTCTHFWD